MHDGKAETGSEKQHQNQGQDGIGLTLTGIDETVGDGHQVCGFRALTDVLNHIHSAPTRKTGQNRIELRESTGCQEKTDGRDSHGDHPC